MTGHKKFSNLTKDFSAERKAKIATQTAKLEGRLTLPQEIQEILHLESGDRLILTLEDNGKLQLVSLKQQVKKLRGLLKDKSPDRNLVDELIQERRQEYLSE